MESLGTAKAAGAGEEDSGKADNGLIPEDLHRAAKNPGLFPLHSRELPRDLAFRRGL